MRNWIWCVGSDPEARRRRGEGSGKVRHPAVSGVSTHRASRSVTRSHPRTQSLESVGVGMQCSSSPPGCLGGRSGSVNSALIRDISNLGMVVTAHIGGAGSVVSESFRMLCRGRLLVHSTLNAAYPYSHVLIHPPGRAELWFCSDASMDGATLLQISISDPVKPQPTHCRQPIVARSSSLRLPVCASRWMLRINVLMANALKPRDTKKLLGRLRIASSDPSEPTWRDRVSTRPSPSPPTSVPRQNTII